MSKIQVLEYLVETVKVQQIIELEDGVLQMNMRSYHDQSARAISLSFDGGETWSDVKHDKQLVESICQASILNFGKFENRPLYLFSNPAVAHASRAIWLFH